MRVASAGKALLQEIQAAVATAEQPVSEDLFEFDEPEDTLNPTITNVRGVNLCVGRPRDTAQDDDIDKLFED